MDGFGRPLQCHCGYEHFERVVVERMHSGPVVTDFLACVGCSAMYFAPEPKGVPVPKPFGFESYGGPQLPPREHPSDTRDKLKDEIREGAKDYVKLGRRTPTEIPEEVAPRDWQWPMPAPSKPSPGRMG